MAQYQVPDADELFPCPYDKSHMVRAKRFPYHLMKCRNNYAGKDFVSCPFNAKHEMPKPELRYHLTTCPDRAMLDQEFAYAVQKNNEDDAPQLKGCTDLPPASDFEIPSSENWEVDDSAPAYTSIDSYCSKVRFKRRSGSSSQSQQFGQNFNMPLEQKVRNLTGEENTEPTQLRLPKTASVAMGQQPLQPVQPLSAVFAYSIGQGQPYNNDITRDPSGNNPTTAPYGRGRGRGLGRGQEIGVLGLGRGMSAGMEQQPKVAPPPGFQGRGRGTYQGGRGAQFK